MGEIIRTIVGVYIGVVIDSPAAIVIPAIVKVGMIVVVVIPVIRVIEIPVTIIIVVVVMTTVPVSMLVVTTEMPVLVSA